jgi:hypothetical protein
MPISVLTTLFVTEATSWYSDSSYGYTYASTSTDPSRTIRRLWSWMKLLRTSSRASASRTESTPSDSGVAVGHPSVGQWIGDGETSREGAAVRGVHAPVDPSNSARARTTEDALPPIAARRSYPTTGPPAVDGRPPAVEHHHHPLLRAAGQGRMTHGDEVLFGDDIAGIDRGSARGTAAQRRSADGW